MSDDAALLAVIRVACNDPGSVLPREQLPGADWDGHPIQESLGSWQARAVLEALAPFLGEADRMRMALERIGPECQNYTTGIGSCWQDRSPDAQYTADRWCDGCIAARGLGMERM